MVQVKRLVRITTSVLIPHRFITPIFLHAGVIHILLNMFAQLSLSAQVNLTKSILSIEDVNTPLD